MGHFLHVLKSLEDIVKLFVIVERIRNIKISHFLAVADRIILFHVEPSLILPQ